MAPRSGIEIAWKTGKAPMGKIGVRLDPPAAMIDTHIYRNNGLAIDVRRVICDEIAALPGLHRTPAAESIRLDGLGRVEALF